MASYEMTARYNHVDDTDETSATHTSDQPPVRRQTYRRAQSSLTSNISTVKNISIENVQETQIVPKSGLKKVWAKISASLTDSWAPEVASLVLSIALLAALASLFGYWHQKPTSTWTAQLSLPTVVVILARASQAALSLAVASCLSQLGWMHFHKKRALIDFQRYDAASRSPWGTLCLLFTPAATDRKVILAFLAVTVGLGFAAAAQQCLEIVGPTAIPVLNQLVSLNDTSGNAAILPDGLRSAAVRSLSAPNANSQKMQGVPLIQLEPGGLAKTQLVPPGTIDYRCGTADCSPQPYATLTLCPSCEDVSDQLETEGDTQTRYESSNSDGSISITFGDDDAYVYLPDGTWASREISPRLQSYHVEHGSSDSWEGELFLANFSIIQSVTYIPGGASLDDVQAGFIALQCAIKACTNVYHLDASSGTAGNESLLASITIGQKGSNSISPTKPLWTFPVPSETTLVFPDGSTGQWKGQPAWTSVYSPSQGMDLASMTYLSGFFESLFNGTASQRWRHGIRGGPIALDPLTYAQQPNGNGFWNSLQYLFGSYYFRDLNDASYQIEGAVSNIVMSMANFLRDWGFAIAAGMGQEYANIYEGATTNTFHIRWPWLIVPAVVEIFAVLLLILTIKFSRGIGAPIWKTSMLPVMLRGVVDDGPEDHTIRVSDMERWAQSKFAQLEKESNTYRLVTRPEDSGRLAHGPAEADETVILNHLEQDPLVSRVRQRETAYSPHL